MPRERSILIRVRDRCRKIGAKCVKTNGEGEPDLICSVRGHTVVIETKQPGEKPEPLQMVRLREWSMSGATACWTDDATTFHEVTANGQPTVQDRLKGKASV